MHPRQSAPLTSDCVRAHWTTPSWTTTRRHARECGNCCRLPKGDGYMDASNIPAVLKRGPLRSTTSSIAHQSTDRVSYLILDESYHSRVLRLKIRYYGCEDRSKPGFSIVKVPSPDLFVRSAPAWRWWPPTDGGRSRAPGVKWPKPGRRVAANTTPG